MLGDEHPDTIKSIEYLAMRHGKQKRWNEAEEMQVQVLEARNRILGEEPPDL